MLRKRGVVGKFVEFTGSGLSYLTLADRATISNMSPEFGATATLFPVDNETLHYLRSTGRSPDLVDLVERYTKAQGLFRTDEAPEPQFDDSLELDLGTIEPSLAGPRRPQDRVPMQNLGRVFREAFADRFKELQENGVTEHSLIRLGTEVGKPTLILLLRKKITIERWPKRRTRVMPVAMGTTGIAKTCSSRWVTRSHT